MTLVAIDLAATKLLWECPLGSRDFNWHSANDIRDKATEAVIIPWGGDLIVCHGWGWLARVERQRGHLRGVLLYDRHPMGDYRLPVTPSLISGTRWSRLPAPRSRPWSEPRVWFDPKTQAPILLTLPPDSADLLAIDLGTWEVRWKHQVTPQTQFLGLWEQQVVLLDIGIKKGEDSVETQALARPNRIAGARPAAALLECR